MTQQIIKLFIISILVLHARAQIPYYYLDYLRDINSSVLAEFSHLREAFEQIDPENPLADPAYLELSRNITETVVNNNITGDGVYGLSEEGFIYNLRSIFPLGDVEEITKIHELIFKERGYNKEVIPLRKDSSNITSPLRVLTKLALKEITKFDTFNEELDVLVELSLRWYDYRFNWNPNDYGQVHKIDLSFHDIWTPQIGIANCNTGQSRFSTEDNTNKVEIWASGASVWEQAMAKQVKCSLDMAYFPFDIQRCTLIIDTLGDKAKIDMAVFREDDSYEPTKLNVWSVIDSRISKNKNAVDDYCFECKQMRYTIILKRMSTTYIYDMVVPCTLLALLSGFSLWIEAGHDQRIQVNLSVLVAISVYQLLASENLPVSDVVPRLTLYLFTQNLLVFSSICITLILWRVKNVVDNSKANHFRIPRCIYVFVVDIIGVVIFIRYDPEFKNVRNQLEVIQDNLWSYASNKLKDKLKMKRHVSAMTRDASLVEDKESKEHQESLKNLIKAETKLFLIAIDRFFAVSYLIVLMSIVIWLFVSRPDDDELIEKIWRKEDEF